MFVYKNLDLYLYNCILFCIFSCFIGVGQNVTNLIAFWFYVCSFVYVNLKLFNTS